MNFLERLGFKPRARYGMTDHSADQLTAWLEKVKNGEIHIHRPILTSNKKAFEIRFVEYGDKQNPETFNYWLIAIPRIK